MSKSIATQHTPEKDVDQGRTQSPQSQTSSISEPFAHVLRLQRTVGNQRVSRAIQAKLSVGEPGDRYEQEADQVAERVMQMPEHLKVQEPIHSNRVHNGHIQRRCQQCEEEETIVQTKLFTHQSSEALPEFENQIHYLTGKGQPLSESTRNFFESRFGYDFSQVRVHTDSQAAETAKSISARAFTLKTDVVFGTGQYSPETMSGKRLLAHELTHVVQQTGGTTITPRTSNSPEGAATHQTLNQPATARSSEAIVQRGLLDFGISLDPATLIGKTWLNLPYSVKTKVINTAIDAALTIVDNFPGRQILGDTWIFIKEGLIGFYGKLRSAQEDIKVSAIDKIAKIMAGESPVYAVAFLKGLVKGFFIDGALGIFFMIWELIKGLKHLWGFFERIAEVAEGFPEEIQQLIQGFKNLGHEISENIEPAIEELKKLANDPKQIESFASSLVEKGKNFAKQGGEKVADVLLDFFSKPESEAAIGEVVGNTMGQVLWEVVFIALTAGAGASVTAAKQGFKAALQFLKRIAGNIVSGFLKLFEEARLIFSQTIELIKGAVKLIKGKLAQLGEKFSKLLEDIREFFAKLLSNCHESKLVCFTKKSSPEVKPTSAEKITPKTKNIYPDFDDVPKSMQSVVKTQVDKLSKQLGIPIPEDRVLSAPWIGRIRSKAGKVSSASTSQGWLRNESRFWSQFKEAFSSDYQLLGPKHTITPEFAQKYGWDKGFVGEKLVHHHIENGQFVVAIPESLHKKLSGLIHAVPTVVKP